MARVQNGVSWWRRGRPVLWHGLGAAVALVTDAVVGVGIVHAVLCVGVLYAMVCVLREGNLPSVLELLPYIVLLAMFLGLPSTSPGIPPMLLIAAVLAALGGALATDPSPPSQPSPQPHDPRSGVDSQ